MVARIVQGMGGAMMTPVGRLVLVRSIDKHKLVDAMAWVTMPALIGPIIGPPVGGFITTYASWHWIFIINVPIGLIGIVLATRYIEDVRVEGLERFDLVGMVLAGAGVAGLAFGLSVAGLGLVPPALVVGPDRGRRDLHDRLCAACPAARRRRCSISRWCASRRSAPTWSAARCSGSASARSSFLLPLMLQLGFDYTPLESGLITFTAAVGAFTMKSFAARIIRRFGFRRVLIVNALISAGVHGGVRGCSHRRRRSPS